MVTYIAEKDGKLYCGECRMPVREWEDHCWFCGGTFSNFEDVYFKYNVDVQAGVIFDDTFRA